MNKVKTFFELIKFEHTVFALPFAYIGMVSARKCWPGFAIFFWVTVAMASARTAGMTLNRIVDISIDKNNPRTRKRALVTGEFKLSWAWAAAAIALVLLFVSARMLNPLCLKLSPIAVLFLTTYHYAKRYTYFCHFVLGSVLAIAPIGGWLAVTGSWSFLPVLLGLAVLFWVAGFDILYALQDIDYDKVSALHSIPVTYGETRSLMISKICHALTVLFLSLFGIAMGFGAVFFTGVLVAGILLWAEHALIADGDLTKLNTAFFTVNGWIGIILFIFVCMEIYR